MALELHVQQQKIKPIVIGVRTPWGYDWEQNRERLQSFLKFGARRAGLDEIEVSNLIHKDRQLRELYIFPQSWSPELRWRARLAAGYGAREVFKQMGHLFSGISSTALSSRLILA